MKKIIFKKGIYQINFPFILHTLDTWENQVKKQMDIVKTEFLPRKNVKYGFEINEIGAKIIIKKLYN